MAVQHTKNQDRNYQGPPEKTVQLVPAFEVQRKSNESEQAFSRPNYYIEENTDVFDPPA